MMINPHLTLTLITVTISYNICKYNYAHNAAVREGVDKQIRNTCYAAHIYAIYHISHILRMSYITYIIYYITQRCFYTQNAAASAGADAQIRNTCNYSSSKMTRFITSCWVINVKNLKKQQRTLVWAFRKRDFFGGDGSPLVTAALTVYSVFLFPCVTSENFLLLSSNTSAYAFDL